MTREDSRTAAVEKWGSMVWRLALARMANVPDAEDLYQEVFLRYFRHEDKFESDEHRRAWLIRCTVNRAKSAHSAPWRHRTLPLEVAAEIGVRDQYREVYAAVLAHSEQESGQEPAEVLRTDELQIVLFKPRFHEVVYRVEILFFEVCDTGTGQFK